MNSLYIIIVVLVIISLSTVIGMLIWRNRVLYNNKDSCPNPINSSGLPIITFNNNDYQYLKFNTDYPITNNIKHIRYSGKDPVTLLTIDKDGKETELISGYKEFIFGYDNFYHIVKIRVEK